MVGLRSDHLVQVVYVIFLVLATLVQHADVGLEVVRCEVILVVLRQIVHLCALHLFFATLFDLLIQSLEVDTLVEVLIVVVVRLDEFDFFGAAHLHALHATPDHDDVDDVEG